MGPFTQQLDTVSSDGTARTITNDLALVPGAPTNSVMGLDLGAFALPIEAKADAKLRVE